MNLLDFDITPAPTPRSLPTITARELESLKSGYLSQISSLKAGLSGKEAEVNSLKDAVGDAERRVGEAQEEVRTLRGTKESLESEREGWQKRGKEMESVMRDVKEEIIRREKEQESLAERLEESERRREEAEMKAAEAETRLKAIRTGSSTTSSATPSQAGSGNGSNSTEVDAAIEQVAMDLHASYKKKHENKVAALKRSYEKRWEKRVKELEAKLEELQRENEELRVGRDLTMSGVVPGVLEAAKVEAQAKTQAEDARKVEEHKARALGLMEEVASVKRDNERLIAELEKERVEKGEMVAAVEEMLSLQAGVTVPDGPVSSGMENLRGSISRASGMKPPGFSSTAMPAPESRIGRIPVSGGLSRSLSGSGGVGIPRSGGIMGNIERMGRTRGE
jgi:myosin heavy subunit